jgi:hypothetical protein
MYAVDVLATPQSQKRAQVGYAALLRTGLCCCSILISLFQLDVLCCTFALVLNEPSPILNDATLIFR